MSSHSEPAAADVAADGEEFCDIEIDLDDPVWPKVPIEGCLAGTEKICFAHISVTYCYSNPDAPKNLCREREKLISLGRSSSAAQNNVKAGNSTYLDCVTFPNSMLFLRH
jgi:hypothetical protein